MASVFEQAVTHLREIKDLCAEDTEIQCIVAARDSVREKYQTVFSISKIADLTRNEFLEFLKFENNKHWTGLQRQGRNICENMGGLRESLRAIHSSEPIDARWNSARSATKSFGHATLSAVIHILYPTKFGVWNRTSEEGLKKLGFWPEFPRGATEGERYKQISGHLYQLAQALKMDLWDLDALMWGLKEYSGIVVLKNQILPALNPQKREQLLELYKRDSKESAWLKKLYGNKCQLCGSIPFNGDLGNGISEAHHIRWISRDGADRRDNMMLLCPNHHAAIHASDPIFNWEKLRFEFAPDSVVLLKINLHLKTQK